ncbi:hypothetical protein OnM2_052064 [Erysiphe neolycopersici]|uniref:CCHC-type domain-containing protein n=1 Tax=Erysiphe neolycopersici TaxID=212602 RepID=A0A420HS98_9PEZI|nr:hypothetical protein OnM2_052064 [Erysiphe neolycopersici]
MSIVYDKNVHLCVGCDRTGHVKPNCKNLPIQLWEQTYLKQMVFRGPGISAHLLVLESEGAYYEEAGSNQNQEHGCALEKASAASSFESEEESISLEAFLTGPSWKRERDLLNSESSSRPRKQKTSVGKPEKNGMKAVKALREIVGREGLGPLNYRALAEKIYAPLNLLEFFQASPDAAKEFRKILQRLNIKKGPRPGNKTKTKAKISADSISVKVDREKAYSREILTQSDFNIDSKTIFPRMDSEHKAFHFVAVLRGKYNEKSRLKKVTLSPGISQGDQGSELNIISQGLLNAMEFPRLTLSREKNESRLFVSTAHGGGTDLKEFTCFNVGVSGIWRQVYALIRSYDKKGSGELNLLLGLPWLYEVNAVISVSTSSIVIGDKKFDGCTSTLNLPEFIPSSTPNLVLQPKLPVAFRSSEGRNSFVAENEDSQADDESSDTIDSEDMMSDTEDTEAESLK